MTPEQLYEALCFGQALAAWNCSFEGARGGMYQVTKEALQSEITSILNRELGSRAVSIEGSIGIAAGEPDDDVLQDICSVCRYRSDR
jgi:hypothetical protein